MRILVVEDQDSIRKMIEALVQARGHQVIAVNSGVRALDAAATQVPDLVLLDVTMPGEFDGIQVCQRLRLDPATQKVPVVMVSAVTDEDTKARAFAAGAQGYYTKPFSPMALLREIERWAGAQSAA
jgi:CheY-like chemotaxis protein